MPDMPSITIVSRFTYRGANEEWSNTYHFSGTTPANATAWKVLADAIIDETKACFPSTVSFVRAYGYAAGNDNSVAQIDYTVAPNVVVSGNLSTTGAIPVSGDVAATTRWYTGATSSRGKKVYCRKYWHGVLAPTAGGDLLFTNQKNALNALGGVLIGGTLPSSFKYCGPQGAVLSAPQTNQYLTTRTLKRRGKRPPT